MMPAERGHEMPSWLLGSGPEADVVVSTRIRLARNLAGHQFPYRASLYERKQIFDEISGAVVASPVLGGHPCVNFAALGRLDQQFLSEARVVSPDMVGLDGDRGFACDPLCRVSVMVNEEDHIRLQCMDSGYRARDLWQAASGIDDDLGGRLLFSFDPRLGFLTCCPTNSGTGLRVSFLMHLPGLVLTKTVDQILQGASQMGISTRGFFGEHSEVVGNFFQLSNQATMGAKEEEFLRNTESVIERVVDHERRAREQILKFAGVELTDKAWRAFGILQYARTLQVHEVLNLASALRVGAECGVFDRVGVDTVNRMVLTAMPAHLQVHFGREMNEDEQAVARAEMVRTYLDGASGVPRTGRRRKRPAA